MRITHRAIIAVAVLLPLLASCAGAPPRHVDARAPGLEIPTEIGYVVIDLADGTVLEAHDADRPFIPASTTKLVTALVALQVLGPDYRFQTSIQAVGEVRGGTMTGDHPFLPGNAKLVPINAIDQETIDWLHKSFKTHVTKGKN